MFSPCPYLPRQRVMTLMGKPRLFSDPAAPHSASGAPGRGFSSSHCSSTSRSRARQFRQRTLDREGMFRRFFARGARGQRLQYPGDQRLRLRPAGFEGLDRIEQIGLQFRHGLRRQVDQRTSPPSARAFTLPGLSPWRRSSCAASAVWAGSRPGNRDCAGLRRPNTPDDSLPPETIRPALRSWSPHGRHAPR